MKSSSTKVVQTVQAFDDDRGKLKGLISLILNKFVV